MRVNQLNYDTTTDNDNYMNANEGNHKIGNIFNIQI